MMSYGASPPLGRFGKTANVTVRLRAREMTVSELRQAAVLDNAALCTAMWRAHGLRVERVGGCVACSDTPPPLYPNVITVDPTVAVRDQLRFIVDRSQRTSGSFVVKDSYRALPLGDAGFEPLFAAGWIHRPVRATDYRTRLDWRPVEDAADLIAWEKAWSGGLDQPSTFLPAFRDDPGVTILAGWADSAIEAGCIVTTTGAVAGLSNIFGDAREAIAVATNRSPDRDLVGYETGDALETALRAGFKVVGDLVIWRRVGSEPAAAPKIFRWP